MTTIEPDDRGLLLACPKCGQRNRLIYERLGQTFRCGRCNNELRPPGEPIRVNSIPAFALFKSGREVARQAGAMPASAIRQFVEQGDQAE